MKTIAIVNRKGGTGKTTTAYQLAYGLKNAGKQVLLIDLDAQGNLSDTADVDKEHSSIMSVLLGECGLSSTAQHKCIDIVASSPLLATADNRFTDVGKEWVLKEKLEPVAKDYDYCIIDTPPALGILSINALMCADTAIIAAQADKYSLDGIKSLMESVRDLRKYLNCQITISGILITRYNKQTILSQQALTSFEALAKQIDSIVFSSKIRESVKIKEAQSLKSDIFTYAANNPAAENVAQDYQNFVNEFLEQEQKESK